MDTVFNITLCDTKSQPEHGIASASTPAARPAFRILRAEHLGMCFGVRDAIALAFHQAEAGPLTVLGELVHNETVLGQLRDRGIRLESQVQHLATERVMVTAHGASDRVMEQLRERGLRVIEATCPLVHFAHRAVASLVNAGFHPVIIGRRDHVEVRGLTDDLKEFDVVLDEADVAALRERLRFGVAAQTTQPIDRVRRVTGLIRRRFPRSEVRFIDTVCQPTKLRQTSAIAVAQRCVVVVVVGGAHSNNTRELVASCRRYCERVHHVQNAADLRQDWFANARTVGLTAGTSTPDAVIDAVEERLREFAGGRGPSGAHADLPPGSTLTGTTPPPP